MYASALDTPYGTLHLTVDSDGALTEIWLPNRRGPKTQQTPLPPPASAGMLAAKTQLSEYFRGRRRAFTLALRPAGSPFELRVWNRLCEIPYGTTTSYGAIATEFDLPNGARAVGKANGSNPIAIVIPCHRVIGANGDLVGYGGGLPLKRALLELEGAIPLTLFG